MNTHAAAADIEEDIRRTRARMESTIDALKEKLSPGEVVDRVLGYVKEGGAEASQSFARRVRANPIPLTLMAASLVWLMVSERRHGEEELHEGRRDRPYDPFALPREGEHRRVSAAEDQDVIDRYERVRRAIEAIRPRTDETPEAFDIRLADAVAKELDLRREASEEEHTFTRRVERAFQQLSDKAAQARRGVAGTATGLARRAGHATQDVAATVKHRAESGMHYASRYYEEHPLVVGALGVAAGALLGSLLPPTRAEDRSLGEVGRTARSYARQAADAAADVAGRAKDAAQDAARREGLSPSSSESTTQNVGARVRRVGEEAIDAGRQEAERRLKGE